MTLEQRARLIAEKDHGGPVDPALYGFALRQLREAVEDALKRAGVPWPTHGEMNGI